MVAHIGLDAGGNFNGYIFESALWFPLWTEMGRYCIGLIF